METKDTKKKAYEAPELTDFGPIEKVTQGIIEDGPVDIPAGALQAINEIVSGVVGE